MKTNVIEERLKAKQDELKQKQDSFLVLVESELDTSCFEQNAIQELVVMARLKAEIKELSLCNELKSLKAL